MALLVEHTCKPVAICLGFFLRSWVFNLLLSLLFPLLQLTEDPAWTVSEGGNGRRSEWELILGPFYAVTCLIEDSPALLKYYKNAEKQSIYGGFMLQQRLSVCRVRPFSSLLWLAYRLSSGYVVIVG